MFGCNETMQMRHIVLNTIYSIMIIITILLATIGLATYQWVEADAANMFDKAAIEPPINVPGLNKVSCGLLTYCIDAAGEVAECSLPWPRYGGDYDESPKPDDSPYPLWNVAAGWIIVGIICMVVPWLYSLIVCFGCFHHKIQCISAYMVGVGGWMLVFGLITFGASMDDLAVDTCARGATKDDNGDCPTYEAQLPSARVEGDEATGCKICGTNMDKFMMSDSCEFGWGGYFVLGAFIFSLITSFVGCKVHERRNKVAAINDGSYE